MQQKILLLAANPQGTTPLRLDEEVREIEAGLQRALHRDQFILAQKWAVQPRDIQRAMLDINPSIVHFSGHGTGDEGLVFEDETGIAKLVDGESLAGLFELFADRLECVVLNGCYSEVQATAIATHVNYVIGMNKAIGDQAAIEFAVGFYDALGAGRPVEFAHKFACAAIRLAGIPEHLTPVLKKKPGISDPTAEISWSSDQPLDAFKEIINIIKEQKNKEIDVITISANNYDHFFKVDKISPEHESVITSKFSSAGGSGANTVCGLSRLGKKTAIVGCVKDDNDGRKIIESFNEFSVDSKLLIIGDDLAFSDIETGNTLILVERFSGRRQILVTPGINNYLSNILGANNEQKLNEVVAQVKKAKILHLTSFAGKPEMELQLSILEQIRDDNIIVSFTPGAIYVAEGLNQLSGILAKTNIMFLYTQQLNQLLERSREMNEIEEFTPELTLEKKVEVFFDWRIKRQIRHPMIIVIKDYSQAQLNNNYQSHIYIGSSFDTSTSFFCQQNQELNIQSNTILPEDTTGTGDALAAGFLYGILEKESIKTCAEFGLIMSIHALKKLGARASLLDETSLKEIVTKNQPS
jgi:sugar/nucleoside kinase (ribokinase family)